MYLSLIQFYVNSTALLFKLLNYITVLYKARVFLRFFNVNLKFHQILLSLLLALDRNTTDF